VTAPTRDDELRALRRPFAIGIALIVLAVVALGVVIARFGSNADRPAGIAERWLVAVGDTTRDGVEDDARGRIEELSVDGPDVEGLIDGLVSLSDTAADEGESAFESVRVGPPVEDDGAVARVPAEVTPRDGATTRLVLTLARRDGRWAVQGPSAVGALEAAGGFPIDRPERAPVGWFVGALALGALITIGCVAAVRAATPKPP
jgi:hypothetical protein